MMDFDFDPNKSATNLKKHGIDFFEAQTLWEEADRLLVPARTQGEAGRSGSYRFAVRGKKR